MNLITWKRNKDGLLSVIESNESIESWYISAVHLFTWEEGRNASKRRGFGQWLVSFYDVRFKLSRHIHYSQNNSQPFNRDLGEFYVH